MLCVLVACVVDEGELENVPMPFDFESADASGTAGPAQPPGGTDPEAYVMSGFSFVQPLLAGMPQPGRVEPLEHDLQFMADNGITLLISLTHSPVDAELAATLDIDVLHLPVEDFQPPTLQQQFDLVQAISAEHDVGNAVGVHCTAGLGRTGTMLSTWFVTTGLGADTAIAEVRALRPGSIETTAQEASVHIFEAAWAP